MLVPKPLNLVTNPADEEAEGFVGCSAPGVVGKPEDMVYPLTTMSPLVSVAMALMLSGCVPPSRVEPIRSKIRSFCLKATAHKERTEGVVEAGHDPVVVSSCV